MWGIQRTKEKIDYTEHGEAEKEETQPDISVMPKDIEELRDCERNENHKKKDNKMMSLFRGLSEKTLTSKDLDPCVDRLQAHLMEKNVSAEVAANICKDVKSSLIETKIGTLNSVTKHVKECMYKAIERILIPKNHFDLYEEIERHRNSSTGRPFSAIVIGVNGVGKSTTLSKLCFWSVRRGFKTLIVAGDTFRSGAVEQLARHVRSLREIDSSLIEIYERGYDKDVSNLAREALVYGRRSGFDVVFIDTAGRMQDNSALMKDLVKIVTVNSPDKILFVGEALVGNEAIDQITKFNYALAKGKAGRKIDGIVLTKFDAVDNKVGAAVSMSYVSKTPILYVGTGQTYMDLKSINPVYIAETLMK